MAYFVTTYLIMFYKWMPHSLWSHEPASMQTHLACLIGAILSTWSERSGGDLDNLALGISGWVFGANWDNLDQVKTQVAVVACQMLNIGVFHLIGPRLYNALKPFVKQF
eukprot:Gregarina_sp_Poly_1__3143@NODE_188_length_11674_cov_170_092100_g167_i0_p8_GENE_NODE_188_length_11674_cov_170_092100_g167_i0NODE_188_length_11674_cov_170_092100_g167_i0_p8_ORF_typecomplete_len109_score1_27_NODE_188_length_11674_cov_170_092100_g167_i01011410440